jgi:outer membrane protein assembly factor BamA
VGRIVSKIVVVDNKLHHADAIRAIMRTRVGKAYDDYVAQADVGRLLATGWFRANGVELSTAVGQDGQVTVWVTVKELSNIVRNVRFVGNQHYTYDELFEIARVRKGSPLDPNTNRRAAHAITEKMQEDGRYYAVCSLMHGENPNDTEVVFNIVEGPKVRIGGVEFRGNQVAGSPRLHTVIQARGPKLGVPTVLTPKFTPSLVEADKRSLTMYYQRLGHLDAQIEAEITPTSEDLSTVNIVYHIREGKPYTVRNIRFDGAKSFDEDRLKKVVGLKPGERYDVSVVQADLSRIMELYGNGGYQVGVREGLFAAQDKANVVDVHYLIDENAAAPPPTPRGPGESPAPVVAMQRREPDRVGRIIIEGNTITQDRVILNQLGLFPGQILQYPKLREAQQNLMRLGIFDATEDPPQVDVVPQQFDSIYKDIRVRVKETRTGMVGLQVGVNSNAGVNGTLAINERNFDLFRLPRPGRIVDDIMAGRAFRGGGQELRIQAMPGTIFQRYEVTWREPYLFDSRFGLTTSGYFSGRGFPEYSENRYGGRVTVDYRFDDSPIWRSTFTTRVEGIDVFGVPFNSPQAIQQDVGRHFLVGLRAGLNRDTRDSFLMPSRGSVLDIGLEQVLGSYQFPIATAEGTKFWTLHEARDGGWKGVLAVRSQLSVTAGNAPVFERFFAGGFHSIRGFAFRGVGPYQPTTDSTGVMVNTGGTFSFLNTIEYQIPLVANERIRFVTFLDHGTVERDLRIDNYRVAAGVGIRLQVPAMGPLPIALDFGIPIVRGRDDQKQLFSFYVGWIGGQ